MLPEPTCPSCKKETFFQASAASIQGVGTVQLVCCEQCGCVVGVINHQKSDTIDAHTIDIIRMVKRLLKNAGLPED